MIFFLLIVTATFHPAAPTVGDLITIEFEQPIKIDASPAFEVMSQQGNLVIVRTFVPKPFEITGQVGTTRFRKLVVPVRSVLRPNDSLEPAPLKPPRMPGAPRLPLALIGSATVLMLAIWTAVAVLHRRRQREAILTPALPPADQFRLTIAELLARPDSPQRWAALADATRRFLGSLTPAFGTELTTAELLPRLDAQHALIVSEILRHGDLEKFSPWGTRARNFDQVAGRALRLIPEPVVEAAA